MTPDVMELLVLLAETEVAATMQEATQGPAAVSVKSIETTLEMTNRFNLFSCISLFVGLTAIGAWFNEKVLKLPSAVGTMLFGIILAGILIGIGYLGIIDENQIKRFLDRYSSEVVLSFLLGLLLFSGAMQLDTALIRKYRTAIIYAATLGTVLSITITGTFVWLFMEWMNSITPPDWDYKVPFLGALLFAAIIAPTDPVAIMSLLRRLKLSQAIRAYVAGESLFNDAISIIAFILLLQLVVFGNPLTAQEGSSAPEISGWTLTLDFFWIAGGAIILGLMTGRLGVALFTSSGKDGLGILVTIGTALGTGGLADALGVSSAVAVTIAGISFAQFRSARDSGSENTRAVEDFWTSIDGVINPLFFALIGLELLVLSWNLHTALAGVMLFPIILFARYASLSVPWLLRPGGRRINQPGLLLMTWAGMRGGVSFALALSMPVGTAEQIALRDGFILSVFIIVVMSVLVQGLTMGPVARALTTRIR